MKMRGLLSVALAVGALFFTIASPAAAVPAAEPLCSPDRACFVECVQELNDCRQAAQKEALACARPCHQAQEEAAKICAGQGRDTRACMAAQKKAAACVKDCRAKLHDALEACVTSSLDCINDCKSAE